MILHTKNKLIQTSNSDFIELSELEYKFIVSISNEKITSIKDIAKYLFKSSSYLYRIRVKNIKNKLCKKIKELQIKWKDKSYILYTKINYI